MASTCASRSIAVYMHATAGGKKCPEQGRCQKPFVAGLACQSRWGLYLLFKALMRTTLPA